MAPAMLHQVNFGDDKGPAYKAEADCALWNAAYVCFKNNPNEFEALYRASVSEAAFTCSFVQFLSRCLKFNRKGSHPERDIGLTEASRVEETRETMDLLMLAVDRVLPQLLPQISDVPGFFAYFILVLLKDVLKEMHRIHMPHPLILQAAQSLQQFSCHYCYQPVAIKILDVATILVGQECLDCCSRSDSLLVCETVIRSHYIILRIIESSEDLEQTSECICRLISRAGQRRCRAVADLLLSLIRLLNRLFTIHLYPESEATEFSVPLANLLSAAFQLLHDILNIYVIDDLLVALSENDSSLMLLLLDSLECFLRLNIIVDRRPDNVSVYESFVNFMKRSNLGPVHMFLWLLKNGVCTDMSVLVDLISGSETVALKYTLRIIKYLNSHTSEVIAANGRSTTDTTLLMSCLSELDEKLQKLNRKGMLPFNANLLSRNLQAIGGALLHLC